MMEGAFYANWIAHLLPLITNVTILDLALPGAHDAMTYDLSTSMSDGYEPSEIPYVVTEILHDLTPLVAGSFIRDQGTTQGLNVTAMLDSGVRFIDFRIMYTGVINDYVPFKKDWYCLHGCQTKHRAIDYLKQVRQWLDQHPSEIVVLWMSRHGSECDKGQYPKTSPQEQQKFFHQITKVFEGMLVDSLKGSVNTTTVGTLIARGQRVLLYTSDHASFTGGSPLAVDACFIDNQLGGSDVEHPDNANRLNGFRSAHKIRSEDKHAGKFFLLSMASSGPAQQIESAAKLKYVPFLDKTKERKKCASAFGALNMTSCQDCWCPETLEDVGLLNNYYNQQTLEIAYQHISNHDEGWDMPNAIYIDGIDVNGGIRTGPGHIQGGSSQGLNPEMQYAYAASLIGSNLFRFCRQSAHSTSQTAEVCKDLMLKVQTLRQAAPFNQWSDPYRGRLTNWPPMPVETRVPPTPALYV